MAVTEQHLFSGKKHHVYTLYIFCLSDFCKQSCKSRDTLASLQAVSANLPLGQGGCSRVLISRALTSCFRTSSGSPTGPLLSRTCTPNTAKHVQNLPAGFPLKSAGASPRTSAEVSWVLTHGKMLVQEGGRS